MLPMFVLKVVGVQIHVSVAVGADDNHLVVLDETGVRFISGIICDALEIFAMEIIEEKICLAVLQGGEGQLFAVVRIGCVRDFVHKYDLFRPPLFFVRVIVAEVYFIVFFVNNSEYGLEGVP